MTFPLNSDVLPPGVVEDVVSASDDDEGWACDDDDEGLADDEDEADEAPQPIEARLKVEIIGPPNRRDRTRLVRLSDGSDVFEDRLVVFGRKARESAPRSRNPLFGFLDRAEQYFDLAAGELAWVAREVYELADALDKAAKADGPRRPVTYYTANDLAGMAGKAEELICNFFFAMQLFLMYAPPKAGKTTCMLEMATALVTGTPAFGALEVPRSRRVLIYSGETDVQKLSKSMALAVQAKGHDLTSVGDRLVLSPFVPPLSTPAGLAEYEEAFRRLRPDVVFVDPIGPALPGVDTNSIFAVYGVLTRVCDICMRYGVTPALLAHTTKAGQRAKGVAPLLEIAGAGFAAAVRQWLAIGEAVPFDGSGVRSLELSAGGSAGHSGAWTAEFHEGTIDAPRWAWALRTVDEARIQNEARRKDRANEQLDADARRVRELLQSAPTGETKSALRDRAGLKTGRLEKVIEFLLLNGEIESAEIRKGNRNATYTGYRLISRPPEPGYRDTRDTIRDRMPSRVPSDHPGHPGPGGTICTPVPGPGWSSGDGRDRAARNQLSR